MERRQTKTDSSSAAGRCALSDVWLRPWPPHPAAGLDEHTLPLVPLCASERECQLGARPFFEMSVNVVGASGEYRGNAWRGLVNLQPQASPPTMGTWCAAPRAFNGCWRTLPSLDTASCRWAGVGPRQEALPHPPGEPGVCSDSNHRTQSGHVPMNIVQFTGAVSRMRKASYLLRGAMLETSGRPANWRSSPPST